MGMILFITRKYPPMIGGMEWLSYRLTTEIMRQSNAAVVAWRRSQRWLPVAIPYLAIRAAARIIGAGEAVRVIHVGDPLLSPLGLALGGIFGLPVACTAHGLDVVWPFSPYQLLIRSCLPRMTHVVAISESTRLECLRRGVAPERLTVIPIGIDLPPPGPPQELLRRHLASIGVDPSGPCLLTVGRLVRRKGVEWFLREVFEPLQTRFPDVSYVVAGEGPERPTIESTVRSLRLRRVHLLGRVDEELRDHLYRAADMFVMPNITVPGDMEGFGVVAVEAASYGLPVVAASIEGVRDAVAPGITGVLVEAANADAFVKAVGGLLTAPEERERLRQGAHQYVRDRLGWKRIAAEYLATFERIAPPAHCTRAAT